MFKVPGLTLIYIYKYKKYKNDFLTNYEMDIAPQLYVSCMRLASLVHDGNDFKRILLPIPPGCQAVLAYTFLYNVQVYSIYGRVYVCYDVAAILYTECDLYYFYFHFVTMAALAQNTSGIAR